MEGIMKKMFEKKVGEFLRVDQKHVHFSASGEISIRQAEFREEVFDQLHFPFALRGGFIEEISANFSVGGMWSSGSGPAKIVIKNVFLVFGPHATDWSWDHVYACKSKLVDLAMKIYELKSRKKKAPSGAAAMAFAHVQKRAVDMAKNVVGMPQVHVSGVHIRYEDAATQASPLACGFKIGYLGVTSRPDPGGLRTAGNWRHSGTRSAEPFVCQAIGARRLSAYWDLGKDRDSICAVKPVSGQEVRRIFMRLNIREAFSACVVEEMLSIFPADHRRRKYLVGPCFRERLDFHQYIVFPASFNAHMTVNRQCDATRCQRAPLKDVDVIFDPLEVAVDSEQLRSMNQLLGHARDFFRGDQLFRTRPAEPLGRRGPGAAEAEARHELVRAWWRHALHGVRLACGIPKSSFDEGELRRKARLREEYIGLCLAEMAASERDGPEAARHAKERLDRMQVTLHLKDVFDWRMLARERQLERASRAAEVEDHADEGDAAREAERGPAMPNTLQARAQFRAFQAFFLAAADRSWRLAAGRGLGTPQGSLLHKRSVLVRQLIVRAQVLDVRIDVAQRGRKGHRVARWLELGVGHVDVMNCNVKPQLPARQILSIAPLERGGVRPTCIFVGATSLEAADRVLEPGDAPLAAVLQPWEGLAGHVRDHPQELSAEQLSRLGFLQDYTDDVGKLMTFIFVKVGDIRAMDYTPFRRRLQQFVGRGKSTQTTDLVRRPSPLALDRELLVKLQRRVQGLTGKSNMLGIVEGELAGVRGRLVDHYNSQYVLCKEVSLAPMQWKARRNGSPQAFHVQFHQLSKAGRPEAALPVPSAIPQLDGDIFGLLPWKVAMLLLPKADFAMELDMALDKPAPARAAVRPVGVGPPVSEATAETSAVIASGATFWKWGRNGRAKRRYVFLDEARSAIVWKNLETDSDSHCLGAIHLSHIQDICTGVQTPVLHRVRDTKLIPEHVWSIVAMERTLDLQADSLEDQQFWVASLKARYRRHLQQGDTAAPLPKELEKKVKAYPPKFRSDRRSLHNTYKKLQAVTALHRSM